MKKIDTFFGFFALSTLAMAMASPELLLLLGAAALVQAVRAEHNITEIVLSDFYQNPLENIKVTLDAQEDSVAQGLLQKQIDSAHKAVLPKEPPVLQDIRITIDPSNKAFDIRIPASDVEAILNQLQSGAHFSEHTLAILALINYRSLTKDKLWHEVFTQAQYLDLAKRVESHPHQKNHFFIRIFSQLAYQQPFSLSFTEVEQLIEKTRESSAEGIKILFNAISNAVKGSSGRSDVFVLNREHIMVLVKQLPFFTEKHDFALMSILNYYQDQSDLISPERLEKVMAHPYPKELSYLLSRLAMRVSHTQENIDAVLSLTPSQLLGLADVRILGEGFLSSPEGKALIAKVLPSSSSSCFYVEALVEANSEEDYERRVCQTPDGHVQAKTNLFLKRSCLSQQQEACRQVETLGL